MSSPPRLVIAAPASGAGKTTVATGLIAALRAKGSAVAPFKVGPDYIDPGYHTLAAGRPGRNLDPVLVGEELIVPLFANGVRDADLAVIEGVMGLFDGRVGAAGFGSTAHVAALLDAPVLLVVDARGQARSLAALLSGFRAYDPAVRLAGVLLNQVGSDRHEQVLRDACEEVGLPVFGALRRAAEVALPSRHLGLVPAAEHGAPAVHAVEAMAELVTRSVDLDAIGRLAASAGPLKAHIPFCNVTAIGEEAVTLQKAISIAGGRAFTFGYAEHTELLRAAGAEVAVFDPLTDTALPEGTGAVLLPGGFPEQHGAALSANVPLRKEIANFAQSGGVVAAECGGLLYLAEEVDGLPMCGVLPAVGAMGPRLTLGYRDAVAAADSVCYRTGERLTGHEFHRTRLTPALGATPAWHWRDADGQSVAEGFSLDRVHASYLHTHPAAHPRAVLRLVRAAKGTG
ncbi:MAG TPA: cobyrinate a,c-diamide synthase [Pseudonocardiaceae bacterium]|nr:cobyrinate a,c-diamide synthase [Pseudonocardiaceae bacterium]